MYALVEFKVGKFSVSQPISKVISFFEGYAFLTLADF
jgi:hypothetical protein